MVIFVNPMIPRL